MVCGLPELSPRTRPKHNLPHKSHAIRRPPKPLPKTQPQPHQQHFQDAVDPLKRNPNEKQKKTKKRALKQEFSKPYKKWLDEDVVWIITDEERAAFKQLSNDEERDNFIEAFWQRRDPTPDTEENEYKEEHYRRIAYANEHFAAGIPGWKTDRGRMYIMYGKPDEIDSHPSGGTYERPMEEGGGETSTFPFEDWRYRYLEGIGQEVIIEFVDTCMCGEYHMTIDRSEKDALLMTPNAGLTCTSRWACRARRTASTAAAWSGWARGRRAACCRPRNSTASSSSPNCRPLRRSNSRIWKKPSTPRSSSIRCRSMCAPTL